jgi:hypothetical protein
MRRNQVRVSLGKWLAIDYLEVSGFLSVPVPLNDAGVA